MNESHGLKQDEEGDDDGKHAGIEEVGDDCHGRQTGVPLAWRANRVDEDTTRRYAPLKCFVVAVIRSDKSRCDS